MSVFCDAMHGMEEHLQVLHLELPAWGEERGEAEGGDGAGAQAGGA